MIVNECFLTDGGDAVADGDRVQSSSGECSAFDLGDGVRNSEGGQVSCPLECVVGDVGQS